MKDGNELNWRLRAFRAERELERVTKDLHWTCERWRNAQRWSTEWHRRYQAATSLDVSRLHEPQTPETGIGAIIGKWPCRTRKEISDERILRRH